MFRKHLLGHPKTKGQREDFDQTDTARFLLSTIPSSHYTIVIYGDSFFSGEDSLSRFFYFF